MLFMSSSEIWKGKKIQWQALTTNNKCLWSCRLDLHETKHTIFSLYAMWQICATKISPKFSCMQYLKGIVSPCYRHNWQFSSFNFKIPQFPWKSQQRLSLPLQLPQVESLTDQFFQHSNECLKITSTRQNGYHYGPLYLHTTLCNTYLHYQNDASQGEIMQLNIIFFHFSQSLPTNSSTVEPCLMTIPLIWSPCYYGYFILAQKSSVSHFLIYRTPSIRPPH